ncbi:fasciclin domain-containing protein [Seonamhaeicola sediminis]|uniref:Fasciclin domain-containing protein n=1 Tax=Seonamhaeicola sediminis TaxID=2528206 RepID=A0A562YDY1_9FLAO|nr:fasciclin domain-containing protein [Seonamhaeicola sediminis]TWO32502.1 fasciclin domain-containing protein [Seonamhaeicola sediminis]
MKTLTATKKLIMLFIASFFVLSCSDDDAPAPFVPVNSIVEIVQSSQLTDLFTALSKYPDLVNTLSGNGTFTVFAPTNQAFDALLAALGQDSIDDIPEDVLRNVLEYHVFASGTVTSNLVSPGDIQMANGETATITSETNGLFIAGAQIIEVDALATNGVIHVVSDVMVPPSIMPIVGTIVAPAYFNKDFTTLIAAVQAADPSILDLLLSNGTNDGGLTLFAPTNDAFTAAGITDLATVVDIVEDVLAYHVIDGTIMKDMLPTSGINAFEVGTLGGNVYLTNAGGSVSLNGTTTVVATDIIGSNGVVHVIDRTLIPPTQTIAEIVSSSSNFTLLTAALLKANLVGAFDEATDGPYTVFAPTDAAFIDAGFADVDAINAAPVETLAAILTHHVVEPNVYVFSTDLTQDAVVPMLNNQNTTIDLANLAVIDASGNSAGLNAGSLNIHATNGVVHVLDKVLLPSS